MKKRKNEMMTRILKNEIRNIEQKQEIEKRQKEERKVKVKVGRSWSKLYNWYKSLAQESKSFLWWAPMFNVSLLQAKICNKAKTKISLKLKQKRKRETETERKNKTKCLPL